MNQFTALSCSRSKPPSLALLVGLLLLGPATHAATPERVPFVWQARVEGIHELLIRNDTVSLRDVSGPAIRHSIYRFVKPLPKEDLDVELDARASRGFVQIAEQPKDGNDYLLRLHIEDRQDGPALDSLAVNWKEQGPDIALPVFGLHARKGQHRDAVWVIDGKRVQATCRAVWSGSVHGATRLRIQNGQAMAGDGQSLGALALMEGTVWPKASYHSVVLATSTEASAEVVEQPSSKNAYTLVIDIQSNSSDTRLEVAW